MRTAVWGVAALALAGCPAGSSESMDARVYDYAKAPVGDKKALIYNLVGRWYPENEIVRLDNERMTPEEWCAREPARIEVFLDDVEVYCESGDRYASPIARVDRTEKGGILLLMRAAEGAKLSELRFEEVISHEGVPNQPTSTVEGTPCAEGPARYARFPKIEMLERQILDGRHCAQVKK
jgi:hypothetical protein